MLVPRLRLMTTVFAVLGALLTLAPAVHAFSGRMQPVAALRTLSFEDGQLVHPSTGADAIIGPVGLERDAPLAGQYSAHFANTDWGHLNVTVAPTDTLFVSFLLKPVSTPETARIALFRHGGKTVGNLVLTADDQLWLRNGDTNIGASVRLPFGKVSRVGLYAQRGNDGSGVLAAYLAAPNAPWGAPFAQSTSQTLPRPITDIRIGATNRHNVNFIADDITLSKEQPNADSANPQPTPTVPPAPTDPTVPVGQLATFRPARVPLDAPELVNPLRGLYRWMGQEQATLPKLALDAYDRYTWRDLEPSEGDYRFTKLEQDIVQAAREGRKYAFRVRALVSEHSSSVPDYLMGRMSRGWWADYNHDGKSDTFVPDWKDPVFLDRAASLIAALGKRYDGDARIAWVDIGLYGNWGEWHTSSFHYPSSTGAERGSTATLHRIVDMHVAAFSTTPLLMLTDNADALVYAMQCSPRIGWRRDSLGWDTGHFEKIETDPVRWNAVKDRWKTAPVITEFVNPRHQADPQVYDKALEQVRRYHVSLVSNGNTLAWSRLSQEGKNAFVALGKTAGYRLRLDQLQLPHSLAPGQPFALETTWANDGVAPVYEPWQVVVQLRALGSDRVAWEGTSTLDLRSVLPDAPTSYTDALTLAPNVAPGAYAVCVIVRDPRATRALLQLANEGRGSDGGYQLGTITVR